MKNKGKNTSEPSPSCDWTAADPRAPQGRATSSGGKGIKAAGAGKDKQSSSAERAGRTRVHRFDGEFRWSGLSPEAYKQPDGSWASVVRQSLTGTRGEDTAFHLRYFEIAAGGNTSLERHVHEHVVICVRGAGVCRVRSRRYELGFMDVIYIPPNAPHQLINPTDEPFGFFCIVDAERDRPVLLNEPKPRPGRPSAKGSNKR